MSATLDSERFSKFFGNCEVFRIPGKVFPIETLFTVLSEPDYIEATIITCI